MTDREKQIQEAKENHSRIKNISDRDGAQYRHAFRDGAQWADEHPNSNREVKCNSGHISRLYEWNCPRCTDNKDKMLVLAMEALEKLAKRHDWMPDMGQCICKEHLNAYEALAKIESMKNGM